MDIKNLKFTKLLAYIGTILVWLPILLTLITGAIITIVSGRLRIDYLMPAELFPSALVGALILLWASKRTKLYRGAVGWNLVIMVVSIVASQGTAVLTGLASGKTEATGWPLFLVLALLTLYVAAVITQCIMGILLLKSLRKLK